MACSTMAVWVAALSLLAAARAGLPLAPNQALGEMKAGGVSAAGLKPALHYVARHPRMQACGDLPRHGMHGTRAAAANRHRG